MFSRKAAYFYVRLICSALFLGPSLFADWDEPSDLKTFLTNNLQPFDPPDGLSRLAISNAIYENDFRIAFSHRTAVDKITVISGTSATNSKDWLPYELDCTNEAYEYIVDYEIACRHNSVYLAVLMGQKNPSPPEPRHDTDRFTRYVIFKLNANGNGLEAGGTIVLGNECSNIPQVIDRQEELVADWFRQLHSEIEFEIDGDILGLAIGVSWEREDPWCDCSASDHTLWSTLAIAGGMYNLGSGSQIGWREFPISNDTGYDCGSPPAIVSGWFVEDAPWNQTQTCPNISIDVIPDGENSTLRAIVSHFSWQYEDLSCGLYVVGTSWFYGDFIDVYTETVLSNESYLGSLIRDNGSIIKASYATAIDVFDDGDDAFEASGESLALNAPVFVIKGNSGTVRYAQIVTNDLADDEVWSRVSDWFDPSSLSWGSGFAYSDPAEFVTYVDETTNVIVGNTVPNSNPLQTRIFAVVHTTEHPELPSSVEDESHGMKHEFTD